LKLVNTSLLSGLHTFIKLLTNVIVGKVFAVYLGPAGISQLGNFMNLFVMLNNSMSGGVNNGVVKFIAESKDNKDQINKIIYNTLLIIFVFSLMSFIIYFIFFKKINKLLLGNEIISYPIIIGVVFAAFFSSLFNFFLSILNGLGQIKKLTLFNILFSVLLLILSVFFVSKLYLLGVILSNLISFLIVSLLSAFIVVNSFKISFSINMFDWNINRQFLQYTLMSFTSILCVPLIQMFLRNYFSIKYGIETAGIWQGLVRLSENYLSIFSIILLTYFLPKYSELKDRDLIKKEILNGYKLIIPFLFVFFIVIYNLRFIIVKILYTDNFLTITEYLPFMFLGDFLKIASWIMSFMFLAKSKTKLFVFSEITFSIILLIGTLTLSPYFQIMGYVYSYIICYFLYFIFCFVIMKKYLYL
jgi:O-antigen/teichoic acid export membrane protein